MNVTNNNNSEVIEVFMPLYENPDGWHADHSAPDGDGFVGYFHHDDGIKGSIWAPTLEALILAVHAAMHFYEAGKAGKMEKHITEPELIPVLDLDAGLERSGVD